MLHQIRSPFLESIIVALLAYKTSRFFLVSVAEQARLSLTWSLTPNTGFLESRPTLHCEKMSEYFGGNMVVKAKI